MIDSSERMENVVLHGACYIFSSKFIQKRKNCFCPDTFLYMEEDILHYECIQLGLNMVYSPEIKVKHLEDVSTNVSIKSGYKKFKMKNREMKRSIEVLINLMDMGD
jgi:GT2 family glycosyltransferase